jgi:hypothetical protein
MIIRYLFTVASTGRMEKITDDLEHFLFNDGPIYIVSWHLPEKTEESHKMPQSDSRCHGQDLNIPPTE